MPGTLFPTVKLFYNCEVESPRCNPEEKQLAGLSVKQHWRTGYQNKQGAQRANPQIKLQTDLSEQNSFSDIDKSTLRSEYENKSHLNMDKSPWVSWDKVQSHVQGRLRRMSLKDATSKAD